MSLFYKTFVIVCVFGFPKPPTQIIPPTNPTGGSCFLNSTGKKTNFLVEMPPCPVGGVSDWLTIAYS